MYVRLPAVVTFRTAGLSEGAANALSKADNKSELIKYLLEKHARERKAHYTHIEIGGVSDGQAARQ
ncbi:MAG: hypothetical protein DDT21_00336 [Syntrophomonadaceae bacterium]|nr:hypothetical protein [Bacillota bacterium]